MYSGLTHSYVAQEEGGECYRIKRKFERFLVGPTSMKKGGGKSFYWRIVRALSTPIVLKGTTGFFGLNKEVGFLLYTSL